MNNLSSY